MENFSHQNQKDSQIILSKILYLSGFIAKRSDVILEKNQYKVNSKDQIFANYEGEWGHEFNIDGVNYWTQGQLDLDPIEKMDFILPSDSTFREDLNWLKKGDEDMAQKFKVKLEEIQRNDRKLRDSNKKK